MMMMTFLVVGCSTPTDSSDAYGNFTANPVMVSSEASGKLISLSAQEGGQLKAGQMVALVDTVSLDLERNLIDAKIGSLPKKLREALSEIEVLEKQKLNLARERDRVERLLSRKAALPKQLDDLNGEIKVLEQRVSAIETQTRTANRAIMAEKEPLLAQRALINERIRRSYVYNPINGTVLNKLAEPNELVRGGSPLYQIANLDTLVLRFYVSAEQLQGLVLGKTVEVLVDEGVDNMLSSSGTVSWISSEAEFTPKTIQTKEERLSLVYAVEAQVPNPKGRYKIGMPAEVNLLNPNPSNNE